MNQLEKAVADLRHAYHQLTEGVVKDQSKFADGLIAPAIYRIEQALEAQHHHPVSPELEREIEQALTPEEPVAWISKTGHGTYFRETITPELVELEFGGRKMWTPLYTAPQSTCLRHGQREWLGLTDEEKRLFSSWLDVKKDNEVFAAIEAKLREKNSSA